MTDKIDSKHPDFKRLCEEQNIEFSTNVHHFELMEDGSYRPVDWGTADIARSIGIKPS